MGSAPKQGFFDSKEEMAFVLLEIQKHCTNVLKFIKFEPKYQRSHWTKKCYLNDTAKHYKEITALNHYVRDITKILEPIPSYMFLAEELRFPAEILEAAESLEQYRGSDIQAISESFHQCVEPILNITQKY